MVEIVKDKASDNFVKPGIFPQKSITGNAGVQLFDEKREGIFENISGSLNINCFFYFCSAVLAAFLFFPQVRGFFSEN